MATGKKAVAVDTDAMEAAGFAFAAAPAPEDGRLRVEAMSVEGFENCGKTSFALSSSELGPTAYIRMDSGGGVMEWFRQQGRVIADKPVIACVPDDVDPDDFAAVAEVMAPKLKEMRLACRAAIDAKFANVVIDTGSAVHSLVSYAINGRIKLNVYGGEGRLRAAVDSAMASLFRLFEEAPDSNLVITHRLKKFNEEVYPDSWKSLNYEVPYIVRAEYDHIKEDDPDSKKVHWIRFIKAKYRPELQGTRVRVDRLTGYSKVAKMLLPTTATADEDDE